MWVVHLMYDCIGFYQSKNGHYREVFLLNQQLFIFWHGEQMILPYQSCSYPPKTKHEVTSCVPFVLSFLLQIFDEVFSTIGLKHCFLVLS